MLRRTAGNNKTDEEDHDPARKEIWRRKFIFSSHFYLCSILSTFVFFFLIRKNTSTLIGTSNVKVQEPLPTELVSSASASFYKRRESSTPNAWKVVEWDNNPITVKEDEKFSCDFVEFKSRASEKSAQICVHSFPDALSGSIMKNKRHGDCDSLSELWNESNSTSSTVSPVYVEIGANIGSCVMEMLLGTDASIIAFEPHPMNLYNLKKTILRLDKSYQDRVTLFPVGLGDAETTSTIYSANNNMGNSVIGTIIKDRQNQKFDEKLQFTIHVERLDSLLLTKSMNVKLMKIDAQGYECRVLEGMGIDIAKKVDQIKFEYAFKWLKGQSCYDLLPRFRNYGFDVFYNKGGKKLPGEPSSRFVDLYAAQPKTNVMEDQ